MSNRWEVSYELSAFCGSEIAYHLGLKKNCRVHVRRYLDRDELLVIIDGEESNDAVGRLGRWAAREVVAAIAISWASSYCTVDHYKPPKRDPFFGRERIPGP